MVYRRGFKTDAKNLAAALRAELDIHELDRLDPKTLAAHLEIPVWALSDFVDSHPLTEPLLTTERSAFSAVTVFRGTQRTVVHNDGHTKARQINNVTHELSHGLLFHPPTAALDDTGCRNWNQDIEDEATWLAGELLVTFESAIAVARGQFTESDTADRLGVSQELIRYRVNMTGARKIVERASAPRTSRRKSR